MKSRPKLLSWLCIGSGIFGISWIIMLLAMIMYSLKGEIPSGLFPGLAIGYLKSGYLLMTALILLTILDLTGVFLMWKCKKSGFYLYSTAKTIIYFLPVAFIGNNHLTFPGLIITSILILLYGTLFFDSFKK
jgi:hypothetical protein